MEVKIMPKSSIIKEIANNSISLEVALNRLKLIASDTNNKEIEQWANNELRGYDEQAQLPEYRKTKSNLIEYSGINGNFQVTNTPLPLDFISEEYREKIKEVKLYQNVITLEQIAQSDTKSITYVNLSYLAPNVYENSDRVIQCTSIRQVIPVPLYQEVIAKIKLKLQDILIALENEYGCLDALENDTSYIREKDLRKMNSHINNEIQDSQIFIVGDKNSTLKNNKFKPVYTTGPRREKWYSKIAWNVIVPIAVALITAAIVWWLGLN
jgi:hypothetical protein